MSGTRLLIIDDNEVTRALYKAWLEGIEDYEYHFIKASSGEKGMELYDAKSPDCVLLDFLMLKQDGFQFLIQCRQQTSAIVPIIFITGYPSPSIEEDALELGAAKFLVKDAMLDGKRLHEAIISVIE